MSVTAQEKDKVPETIQTIIEKVENGEYGLTKEQAKALKSHIRASELSRSRSFLEQHGDLNANGNMDGFERDFIQRMVQQGAKEFDNAWKGIKNGKKALDFIPPGPGRKHAKEGMKKGKKGIKRGKKGRDRGLDRLEKALKKAHQALQRAREKQKEAAEKAKEAANRGNGEEAAEKGKENAPLDSLEKQFDRDNDGSLNKAERQKMEEHLKNRPIAKFSRSLRKQFLDAKNELLDQPKGKNLRDNPVNLLAKSLRTEYLQMVSERAEEAMNGADRNENEKIDPPEEAEFGKQAREKIGGEDHAEHGDDRGDDAKEDRPGREDNPGSEGGDRGGPPEDTPGKGKNEDRGGGPPENTPGPGR